MSFNWYFKESVNTGNESDGVFAAILGGLENVGLDASEGYIDKSRVRHVLDTKLTKGANTINVKEGNRETTHIALGSKSERKKSTP